MGFEKRDIQFLECFFLFFLMSCLVCKFGEYVLDDPPDKLLPQDVTGVVGQTAYLTCRVFDRTNKTVNKLNIKVQSSVIDGSL